jgi:polyisoprenoid-binding protein YceI
MNGDLSGLAGTWTLDPRKTTISFRAKVMGFLPVTGTLDALSGQVHVSPDSIAHGALVIDAASLDTKNTRRDDHLRSEDFLDVVKDPTIVFTADGGRPSAAGRFEIDGLLALHGQSHPLTLPPEVDRSGDAATVATEVVIDRRRWGMSWGTKLGVGRNSQVTIRAHFDREPSDPST